MDVEGLYFADNDNIDANILKSMIKIGDGITTFLQTADHFILDRDSKN